MATELALLSQPLRRCYGTYDLRAQRRAYLSAGRRRYWSRLLLAPKLLRTSGSDLEFADVGRGFVLLWIFPSVPSRYDSLMMMATCVAGVLLLCFVQAEYPRDLVFKFQRGFPRKAAG